MFRDLEERGSGLAEPSPKHRNVSGPLKMPLEPLSTCPQFLSGRFWPISIRKTDLGPDLGNFYPDAG